MQHIALQSENKIDQIAQLDYYNIIYWKIYWSISSSNDKVWRKYWTLSVTSHWLLLLLNASADCPMTGLTLNRSRALSVGVWWTRTNMEEERVCEIRGNFSGSVEVKSEPPPKEAIPNLAPLCVSEYLRELTSAALWRGETGDDGITDLTRSFKSVEISGHENTRLFSGWIPKLRRVMTGLMSASAGDSERVRLFLPNTGLIKLCVGKGLEILRFELRTPEGVSSCRSSGDEYRVRNGESGWILSALTSFNEPNFRKLPASKKIKLAIIRKAVIQRAWFHKFHCLQITKLKC